MYMNVWMKDNIAKDEKMKDMKWSNIETKGIEIGIRSRMVFFVCFPDIVIDSSGYDNLLSFNIQKGGEEPQKKGQNEWKKNN